MAMFDYGKAVSDGQGIAQNALKLREQVQDVHGMNMLNALRQQGAPDTEALNALRTSGYSKTADTYEAKQAALQAQQMDAQSKKAAMAKQLLSQVTRGDVQGLEMAKQKAIEMGISQPGGFEKQFGESTDPKIWDRIDAMLGRSPEKPQETFSPIYDSEGRPIAQQSDLSKKVISDPRAPKDPLVQINNGKLADSGLKKATEKFGEGVGDRANERNTYAASASRQKAQLETVALAMANGAKSGKWEETIMEMKSAAKTLGIPVGDLSGQELIRTVSNEMALRLRNPDSGLGLTGNTSNRDLEFLKASVVGLGRTTQGNIEIIKLLNKFNDMTIDVAAEQNRIIMRNGGIVPIDIDSQLIEYANNYEFFTKAEREKITKILDKGKSNEDYGDMNEEQIKRLQELREKQGAK